MDEATWETERYERGLRAQLPSMENGRLFFEWVKREHGKADKSLKDSPKICDEDFKKDFRYKLGYIAALKKVMDEPQKAQEELLNL